MPVITLKNEDEVLKKLQNLIEGISNEAITSRGKFTIGFSGKVYSKVSFIQYYKVPFTFQGGHLENIYVKHCLT